MSVKYAVKNVLSGEVISFWYNGIEFAEKALAMYQKRYYNRLRLEIVTREFGE